MTRSILFIVLLILLSAFFSGSEISYASASDVKLRKAAENAKKKNSKETYANQIKDDYENALISILIGNNLVNIASSAVATVIAIGLMGDAGAGVATLIMTVIIIIFGEITPKIVAARKPEDFAFAAAVPLHWFTVITKPLVYIFSALTKALGNLWEGSAVDDAVTEDDLETIFETAEDEGVVDEDTADLLQSALEFDDVLAYEIITPRVDMEAIDIEDSDEEIIDQIMKTRFSRLPVYEDTPDTIIGIAHVNQCLRSLAAEEKFDLRALMMEAHFVHKTMPLDDVFETMQREGCHMVIVTDEYGGTMGILTMEDVLEQIVGEIWDEKDEIDEEFVELDPSHYEVDADMRLEDFFDELDLDEEKLDDDNATVGGWAIEMLGGYPEAGESFEYENVKVTVAETEGMRVTELLAEVIPEEEETEEEEE
ncbi:MAG: HlyC/CorC family transporter [Firmicutes bacterium]|nr:HlyC/CorC family transporter [Bacillota bacterium]